MIALRPRLLAMFVAATAVLLAMPGVSDATTGVAPFSIAELTGRADLVIDGRVEQVESFIENQNIFTRIEITISESWKGSESSNRVTLKLLGGEYGGTRTMVIGAACITSGEHAVFFLKRNSGSGATSTYDIVNLSEGKFNVGGAGAGGAVPVTRDTSGIRYLSESAVPVPATLQDLEAAVRASATREGEGTR